MNKKDELNVPNALSEEKLVNVSGGADGAGNESAHHLSRHNIRSPLTGAGFIPLGGMECGAGEKKATDFHIELLDEK